MQKRKYKKKTDRKKLDEYCLTIWGKIIRSKGKCTICGKTDSLQAHHIISRRYNVGRHALDNGLCICSSCHFFEKPEPERFRDMVLGAIGEDRFKVLKEKYILKSRKISLGELDEIKAGLKEELKQLSDPLGLEELPF